MLVKVATNSIHKAGKSPVIFTSEEKIMMSKSDILENAIVESQ